MSTLAPIESVVGALQAAERVLIVSHESPDGDTLGGGLALGHMLEQLGKSVTHTCRDDIPRPFRFLPGIERIQRDCLLGTYDAICIVDCGDLKRTGLADRIREFTRLRGRIINIDHHQRNDLHKLAAVNFVDFEASSASELVFLLGKALKIEFTPDIATCVLAGLYNDTGGFKHSNTSPRVLEQAAELMAAGARLGDITDNMANYKSVPALKLWGMALTRLQYHAELSIVTSLITQDDLRTCNAYGEDLAGCVNLINCVPQARAAILLCELPDGRIKGSLRTEHNTVNVAALANLFGGGGIKKAAGFSFAGQFRVTDGRWTVVVESSTVSVAVAPEQLAIPMPMETLTFGNYQTLTELEELPA